MGVTARVAAGNMGVIAIDGRIDSTNAAAIEEEVLSATTGFGKVVLDLSSLDYISSAGLRILLLVYRKIGAAKGRIALAGPSEEIKDIMYITGFTSFFVIVPTIQDAIDALS